ncbi:methylcrotonoyl-CoA carboxylase beta chain, mitochondrial-like [Tubulanus polymorphus]|uniref:methylcrotonoyl-CoA carboxylase beta chain, mitochondrial-like n=1 Tax=Tubulanus polymorphus TaxID=672921 RepID=UPI003DA26D28
MAAMFRLCVGGTRNLTRTIYTNYCRLNAFSGSAFPVLDGKIDANEEAFKRNVEQYQKYERKISETLAIVKEGGGEKAKLRHVKQNKKVLPRDRIKQLLDEDSERLELMEFTGLEMPYGSVPAAGVISVIGKINGRPCMVVANDATVKGGTLFPISVKKQLRCQEISEHNRIPCIYVVDSGGAFLPLQSEIFPDSNHGGRVFYNEAVMSAQGIHQIAVVCGSCTAGGAYVPTMADEAVIIERIGHVFLAGPPLVQAALGVKISADDLGGAMLHSSVSGCTDYYAETEDEAYKTTRDIVLTLNIPELLEPNKEAEDPVFDAAEIPGLIPIKDQHNMNMYKVLARLVDGSRFHEFKAKFGSTLITGFCHIQGQLAGIIANNGSITDSAASKATHFVQLCNQRDIPMIFLQNTHPSDALYPNHSNGFTAGDTIRAQGRLMAAVSSTNVPKITIVVGNSFGPANFMMAGRSTSPRFVFSWPNSQTGMYSPTDMVKISLQDTADDEMGTLADKLTKKYAFESSAFFSSSRLLDDGIILPQDTRRVLAQCLSVVNYSTYLPQMDKRQTLFRM